MKIISKWNKIMKIIINEMTMAMKNGNRNERKRNNISII